MIQLLLVSWCEACLAPPRVPTQIDVTAMAAQDSLAPLCVLCTNPKNRFFAAAAQDRLATLEAVRAAGISVCAGGIIGLGEGPTDRVGLLHQLATLRQHPESVPINALARPLCPHTVTQHAVLASVQADPGVG